MRLDACGRLLSAHLWLLEFKFNRVDLLRASRCLRAHGRASGGCDEGMGAAAQGSDRKGASGLHDVLGRERCW